MHLDASSAHQYIRTVLPNLNEDAICTMRHEWSCIADRVRIGAKERVGEWVEEVIRAPSVPSAPSSHRRALRRLMP